MKFSYKWLKELSGVETAPDEIAHELTVKAFEVEAFVALDKGLENVVVGHVVEVEKHPDADRLNVAQVDIGADENLQIVCGAPNLEAGQKIPVALVGAILPTKDGEGFEIKKSTIRGVQSNGMICAEDELGLGGNHEGIMMLDVGTPVGTSFAEHMGLDDTVLDIDILPNRAHDCLSHKGVAREIAAIEGRVFQENSVADEVAFSNEGDVNISVETNQCLRYTVTVIDDVDNTATTPQWMVARLTACGLRSVNPIVDITNYVMLETGQPLHAFDRTVIVKDDVHIGVRMAMNGEKMTLLDKQEIELVEGDIVITDGVRPIALAGVMGGIESGITIATTQVVVEVAAFDAATIRKTRIQHGIVSDAAYRFERDLDPNLVVQARERAVGLIADICGGTIGVVGDIYPKPVKSWTVALTQSYVMRLLGVDITKKEIVKILGRLGIIVTIDEDMIVCTIPTVRRDLQTAEDIIEEIGRLYGLENITPQPLMEKVAAPEANEQRAFEHRTRDICVTGGFDEVKGYSFYSKDDAVAMGLCVDSHVALINPMSTQQSLMRRTLVPAMMRACARNRSHSSDIQIFEVGRTYTVGESREKDVLPKEHHALSVAVMSKQSNAQQFFDLKGMVNTYLDTLGICGYFYDAEYEAQEYDSVDFHPSRRAIIRLADKTVVGMIGEVSKKAMKHFGIKNARVAIAELNLDVLQSIANAERFFAPIPKYPTIERDLSMIVGSRTRVADVERVLYSAGDELLQDIDLFDLYINKETQERSMAFHFIFGSIDRTLTSKEVDTTIAQMISAAEEDKNITVKK